MQPHIKLLIDLHIPLASDHELISDETRRLSKGVIIDLYNKGDAETKKYISEKMPEICIDYDELAKSLLRPLESDQILEGQFRYGYENQRTKAILER